MEHFVPYNKIKYKGGKGKMFCPKCGAEVEEDADVCVHCGRNLKQKEVTPSTANKEHETPKTGIGVVMGLFLGLIGLIIGICLYPEGTVARKTFIKAWGITFGVTFAVGLILGIIIYVSAINTMTDMVYNFTYPY